MEHTTGQGETTAAGGTLRSGMHLHSGAPGDAPNDHSRGDSSQRGGYADRISSRFGQLSDRLGGLLDDRAHLFAPIRKYPLVAVGVAFTVGLALASRRSASQRHWMIERPRRQLRTLLIGTATAALVSELHNLAETDERIRKLLGAYLGDLPLEDAEDEDDYDDFEDYDEDDEDELPPLR